MKKTYDAIDAVKFLASALIFAMHCDVLRDYPSLNMIPQLAARWGVPFFFICSAFFLFRKSSGSNIEKSVLYGFIRRIAQLYAVWFVFNLPSIFPNRFYGKELLSFRTWFNFIWGAILSSTFTGSWYLISSIFSSWFIYTLSRRFQAKTIMGITSVFYILCTLNSAYYGALPTAVQGVLSFLCFPCNIFTGCFYFAIGKFIAENREAVIRIFDRKKSALTAVAFYLLFLGEVYLTKQLGIFGCSDAAFSLAGMSTALFLFCLQSDVKIRSSVLLRKLSIIVFCCQGNILNAKGIAIKLLKLSSLAASAGAAAAVAMICWVVLRIQKDGRWRLSRYLT